MKKIVVIILILNSHLLFAQHPDLGSHRWYIQKITLNGTTTELPQDNIEFPFAYLNFLIGNASNLVGSSNFEVTNNCQIGFTGHVSFTGTTLFTFDDFSPFSTTTNCNFTIQDFMNLMVSFYNDGITENFTYTITNLSDRKTLIVTNNAGNQITYTTKIFEDVIPEIAAINWILTDLIIDGVNYTPPNNDEVSSVNVFFINNEYGNFSTGVCAGLFGMHNFNTTENQFHLYELITTLNHCGETSNLIFENVYLGFFWNNLTNPFDYSISGEFLTITDISGNTAQYHNGTASVEDNSTSLFNIYPNPIKDILIVEGKTNNNIENINIYNYLGEKLFSTTNETINMSHLESGIYIIKIKLQNGKIAIKKIIKS